MKSKKTWIALAALVVVAALLVGVYFVTRPETQKGSKHFTVTVVHADGTEKVFDCYTDEEFLGAALLTDGIIVGHEDQYGLVVDAVDGEEASWERDGAYWALYVGEEYATTGISTTPATDGASYKLAYEKF